MTITFNVCNVCIPCKNRVFIVKFISKEEFKPTRKKWPFKDLGINDAVELPSGFNDCSVKKIAVAARTYEAKSSVTFLIATIKKGDGTSAVQVLRTK